jgi:hypothetical protein
MNQREQERMQRRDRVVQMSKEEARQFRREDKKQRLKRRAFCFMLINGGLSIIYEM